jgi:hypothetical protein
MAVSSSPSSTSLATASTTLPDPLAERAAFEMQALRKAMGWTADSQEERPESVMVDSSARSDSSDSAARTARGSPELRMPSDFWM